MPAIACLGRLAFLAIILLAMPLVSHADERRAQAEHFAGKADLDAGRLSDAEAHFAGAIAQLDQDPSVPEAVRAFPLSGLATVYLSRGELGRALETASQAETLARAGGPSMSEALFSALVVRAQVETEWLSGQAEDTWQEALALAGRLAPQVGAEILYSARNNYAEYLRRSGEIDAALAIHGELVEKRRAARSNDPQSRFRLAGSQINLAATYADAGQPMQAEKLLKSVMADAGRGTYSGSDEIYGRAASNLSPLLSSQKRDDEAVDLTTEALARLRDSPPSLRLTAANNLAIAQYIAGRPQVARQLFEQVYMRRLEQAWEDHPEMRGTRIDSPGFARSGLASDELLISAANLAYAYQVTGKADAAIALFDGLLAVTIDSTGPQNAAVARALADAGDARVAAGRIAQGRERLQRAYDMLVDAPEHEAFRTIVGYRLGAALLAAGRPDEALLLIEPYSEAMLGYSGTLDMLSRDQLRFERFSRQAHERLLEAAWQAERPGR